MADGESTPEELARQQENQETSERDALADAETPAAAEKHERRADKARYLRQKLLQQQRADREARRQKD